MDPANMSAGSGLGSYVPAFTAGERPLDTVFGGSTSSGEEPEPDVPDDDFGNGEVTRQPVRWRKTFALVTGIALLALAIQALYRPRPQETVMDCMRDLNRWRVRLAPHAELTSSLGYLAADLTKKAAEPGGDIDVFSTLAGPLKASALAMERFAIQWKQAVDVPDREICKRLRSLQVTLVHDMGPHGSCTVARARRHEGELMALVRMVLNSYEEFESAIFETEGIRQGAMALTAKIPQSVPDIRRLRADTRANLTYERRMQANGIDSTTAWARASAEALDSEMQIVLRQLHSAQGELQLRLSDVDRRMGPPSKSTTELQVSHCSLVRSSLDQVVDNLSSLWPSL